MTNSPLFIGLDVGGTFMKAGVVDDTGKTLSSDASFTCASI